ncbi:MAG: glycosyltransferase family 2 protein [Candidatus Falkowbacteria bacterium]|nr:glycosyltransferase family 2 protein [Candidatus Falkowbacteria bacterium]
MDFSIVIVAWNVKDKLKTNLSALLQSTGVNMEIFVVDNASVDKTAEMVASDFPQVKLISNEINLGFAKACNQAIKQSSGRYVLLLNPDMKVKPDTLASSLSWLDSNEQAAITGIRLTDEQGKTVPQVRNFPTLFDQFLVASKLAHVMPFLLNNYYCPKFNYEVASKVDSIRGSFFIIRRSTIELLGLLDEQYFIWFEEVDYCRLAHAKGLETWYTPVASATDYVGQSFKQVDIKIKQTYVKASMLSYFKKWHKTWEIFVLRFAWWIGDLIVKLFT